jgi:hypothetical protein
MSARGFWIVALGAALAVLIALNVFRPEEPGSADANVVSRPSSGGGDEPPPDETAATQPPVEAARGSPSGEQRAESSDASPEPRSAPAPLPTSGPYASISAALAEHDVPPERRIQPSPELLEVERAFAAESVDPLWSTAAEGAIFRRIAEIPAAAYASLNVECRTTLCLLQFVQSATPVPNSGIVEVANLVKPDGLKPGFMIGIRVRGGAAVGIAYLRRVETTESVR